jgi:hypothetical protein
LHSIGRDKLLKQTIEETEFKRFLDSSASHPEQRLLMNAFSYNDLKSLGDKGKGMFKPKINDKSRNMSRAESVEMLLYKDASEKKQRLQ